MAIQVKTASSELELNDVFNLRYRVFCKETGRIRENGRYFTDMIIDQYDTYKSSKNIVAYDNKEPIGIARINFDSKAGLPPDRAFDLAEIRDICKEHNETLGSVSMLALSPEWRNKHVLEMIFEKAADELKAHGVDVIVANISARTLSIYRRMGFSVIGDSKWSDTVNDELALITAPASQVYRWIERRSCARNPKSATAA